VASPHRFGEAALELAGSLPQLLDLIRSSGESPLQVIAERGQADDVVELVGRHARLVAETALRGFVLAAGRFGRPLAWPATARPRRLLDLVVGHARIVAHFRA
jgi:hypothetical protein